MPGASSLTADMTGKLVVVVLNGPCEIFVDGVSGGVRDSATLMTIPGNYEVRCVPSSGKARSKKVDTRAGETAMVTFKL